MDLLVVNESNNDWTIANESDFLLPNTANALKLPPAREDWKSESGVARINGDNTGIILDGLLRVSGGELDMDDVANNGNNFIEYGSSSASQLLK